MCPCETVNMFSTEEVSNVKPSCYSLVWHTSIQRSFALSVMMVARPISQFNLHKCSHASMIVQGSSFQWTLSALLYTRQADKHLCINCKENGKKKKRTLHFWGFWLISKLRRISVGVACVKTSNNAGFNSGNLKKKATVKVKRKFDFLHWNKLKQTKTN